MSPVSNMGDLKPSEVLCSNWTPLMQTVLLSLNQKVICLSSGIFLKLKRCMSACFGHSKLISSSPISDTPQRASLRSVAYYCATIEVNSFCFKNATRSSYYFCKNDWMRC